MQRAGRNQCLLAKVTEVDTDAENTDGSDVADEYSDKESEGVKNRLTRVKRVRVLWGNEQKDDGFPGGGKILELVLDSGATSPIRKREDC